MKISNFSVLIKSSEGIERIATRMICLQHLTPLITRDSAWKKYVRKLVGMYLNFDIETINSRQYAKKKIE